MVMETHLLQVHTLENYFKVECVCDIYSTNYAEPCLYINEMNTLMDESMSHLPLANLTRVQRQEHGRIEYYICLCGPLGGVSEIQTSLDVSDLRITKN